MFYFISSKCISKQFCVSFKRKVYFKSKICTNLSYLQNSLKPTGDEYQSDRDYKSDIVLTSNDSLGHKSPISCLLTDSNYFFLDLEIWWGFQIRYCTFPQMTHWTTNVRFLVHGPIWIFFLLLWLGNSMGIPNPILYFT